MFHSFVYITTTGYLAAILDFRHEVTFAMIAGDLDVSYPCIVFGMTCVSVKPAMLNGTYGNLASWISGAHRRPTKSEVSPLESLTQNI